MRCCQARFKAGNRCGFPPTAGHVPPSTRSLLKCSWVLEVEFVRYELEMETAQQTRGTDGKIPVGTWERRSGRGSFSRQGRQQAPGVCTAAGPKHSPTFQEQGALPGGGAALTWVIPLRKEFEIHGKAPKFGDEWKRLQCLGGLRAFNSLEFREGHGTQVELHQVKMLGF